MTVSPIRIKIGSKFRKASLIIVISTCSNSKEKIHHVDEPCYTPAVNVIIAKPKVLTDIMNIKVFTIM